MIWYDMIRYDMIQLIFFPMFREQVDFTFRSCIFTCMFIFPAFHIYGLKDFVPKHPKPGMMNVAWFIWSLVSHRARPVPTRPVPNRGAALKQGNWRWCFIGIWFKHLLCVNQQEFSWHKFGTIRLKTHIPEFKGAFGLSQILLLNITRKDWR